MRGSCPCASRLCAIDRWVKSTFVLLQLGRALFVRAGCEQCAIVVSRPGAGRAGRPCFAFAPCAHSVSDSPHPLSAPATRHVPMCAMSDVRARCARSRRSRGLAGHVHAARTVMGHSVSLARTRENRDRSSDIALSVSHSCLTSADGVRERAKFSIACKFRSYQPPPARL